MPQAGARLAQRNSVYYSRSGLFLALIREGPLRAGLCDEFGDPAREVFSLERSRWQTEVRRLIALMGSHAETYGCRCAGLDISVLPQVFSPAYFTDSEWFATEIAAMARGAKLLDVGTGTGIVALASALAGAEVTATDINPAAVENAKLNFSVHGVAAPALLGDVYGALARPETFDLIFWNHPFNLGINRQEDPLSLCGFDFEYRGVRQFIENGPRYLSPGGRLVLGTSTFAEVSRIARIAAGARLDVRILRRKQTPLQWRGAAVTELRIVEFVPRP